MASAHKYSWVRKDGSVGRGWRAKYSTPDGVRSRRGFDRKSDAVKYAEDREAEQRHGLVLEVPVGALTLAAWSKEWLAGRRVRPSTAESYRYAVKRITDDLGTRPLTALRRSELEAWRKSIDPPRMAAATAAHTASVLGMILRAAVEDDLIPKSPMPVVRGGSGGRLIDPDELLTFEQVRAWGAKMPKCAREMPVLAAMTGLRQGELLGLRVPHVDFLRREIRVVEQLLTPAKGEPTWGPPKTAAGVRTVPLPEEAVDALARHLAAFPPVDGVVFRSPRGRLWRRQTFGDTYRKAATAAKLPAWAHWHGCRDLYASVLLRQGVDSQSLIAVMGHTSLVETRVYARLMPDSRENVRASVGRAWSVEEKSAGSG